jgi:4-amino-4-deoxy-L-arabinose transferase-like glycosyltransferase
VLASAVLAVLGYRTRDPDSLLYAAIAAQLSTQPPSTWIAPSWPPGWYGQGRFREHPVGVFVLPALLARAGYPAQQAAYAVNACYQVLALLLLPLLAASFVQAPDARRLAWLLQLLPVAFVYRVRANQEPALLLLLLLALYATERSRESPRFGLLTAAALGGVMLVKGLTVLPALLACAAWLAVRGLVERKRTGPAWWGLLGALVLLFVTAWAYEAAYLRATGESFLDYYAGRATRADPNPASAVSDTLYNVVWYAGRVLWMAAPWSLFALAATSALRGRGDASSARAGALFTALVVFVYVGAFSLGERRAERYIFPVYYLVGACGALLAMRRSPRLEKTLARLDGPYVPVLVWAAAFALHLLGGWLQLPRLKFWKADV